MPLFKKIRVANPHRKSTKRRRKAKRASRRKNGGELLLMANPKRKKRNSRRRRNPVVSMGSGRRSRRRNSYFAGRSRRRRNPSLGGLDINHVLKIGAGAAAGAVGTRALTQMVLQSKNTGVMGYGANFAVALGLGFAAQKFVGKEVGVGVTAGGIAGLILRLWTEKVSQSSAGALSGLGDVDFSSDGLGGYLPGGYAVPQYGLLPASMPAGAGNGSAPATTVDRFASRF